MDALLLREVFPEAHQVFEFRPKSLEEIFPTAVFVLDTNALLVPYGVGKASLDDIGTRYENLVRANRLLVPAHVAREFAHQRAEKIKNLYSALSKTRNQTRSRTDYAVLVRMAEYPDLSATEKEVDASISKRDEVLDRVLARIRSWRWDDLVSELYRRLFTATVVVESDIEPDKARVDCKNRLDNRLPPGYRDSDKPVNAAGDILVWHTVLSVARARPGADVVLISGDAKNDWFYRSENAPLYPRFELTDEYRRASGGGSFSIVTLTDLLRRLQAPSAVVDEVQVQEVLLESRRPKHHWGFQAENAVARWLITNGYDLDSCVNFPDFIARRDSARAGVEVKLVSPRPLWSQKLRDIVSHSDRAPSSLYDQLMVFFVALEKTHAERAYSSIGSSVLRDTLDRPIHVHVGSLDSRAEFVPLKQ